MAGRGAYQQKAQNIENLRARRDLLIEGIKTPASVDKAVNAALVGQRAFASLNLSKHKIEPLALNTIKSLSDELFTDPDGNGRTGFDYFNALRVRLREKVLEVAATRTVEAKATREADKTSNCEARLAATEAQSAKRQKAYLSLYATVNGLIANGNLSADAQERLYRALENHHAAFAELFEPEIGRATGIEAKVTKLHGNDEAK